MLGTAEEEPITKGHWDFKPSWSKTDDTHTDFNQTWTRDGTNTPIWNRKHPVKNSYQVMAGKIGGAPGEEVALTDSSFHTWGFTCLIDGRILVASTPPKRKRGYYLMTTKPITGIRTARRPRSSLPDTFSKPNFCWRMQAGAQFD